MEVGTRHGRYELIRLVGRGGAGSVYEAVLHGAGGFTKRVALKVLDDEAASGGAALASEARLGGLLQHPNLVEVYALEQVDGVWVCAMELVRGGSLRDLLPLPPRAVVDVGLQVCRGLQHAHDRIGLVHLDLKPDNLLVDNGIVKVADLGIARARGHQDDGKLRGTPAYMSPEHWGGGTLGPQADIFSLGVTLAELALGRPENDPRAVPWMRQVLQRCLVLDPADRYPSMLALAEDLAQLTHQGKSLDEVLGTRSPVPAWVPTRSASASLDTFTVELSTDQGPRTNLIPSADRFVGRAAEVRALRQALHAPGVVTIKGPGGIGKTRLVRRAARLWHEATGGQAWFCDLSAVRSRSELLQTLAAVLDLASGRDGEEQLTERIGHAVAGRGDVAVILDNFEQLTDFAELVDGWGARAPRARWVVTSRVALRRPGESVIELGPMVDTDAVELLVQRAAERGVSVEAGPELESLAERLDGIPLALELAAGRLGMIGAAAVLSRLDQRFRLLRSDRRSGDARQATLRGTLDWSWELLEERERAAVAQCAVFVGSFTVEDAEAVLDLPDEVWALDVIDALIEHSWLAERDGRLRLYESARVYALEKLEDRLGVERRHGIWFARLGDDKRRLRAAMGHRAPQDDVGAALEDVAAACRRAAERGEVEIAAQTGCAAWRAYDAAGPYQAGDALLVLAGEGHVEGALRIDLGIARAEAAGRMGRMDEAFALLDEVEALEPDPLRLGLVLAKRGTLALVTRRRELAGPTLRRALEQFEGMAGVEGPRGLTQAGLARLLAEEGDWDGAEAAFAEALASARQSRQHRLMAVVLGNLGKLAADRGRLDEAARNYLAALAHHQHEGDTRSESTMLLNLGLIDADRGDFAGAVERLEGAIERFDQMGERRLAGTARCNLGNVLADTGDPRAEGFLRAAIDVFQTYQDPVWGGIGWGYLGRLQLHRGEVDQALISLGRATDQLDGRYPVAWGLFVALRGEARGLAGDPSGIEDLEAADALMDKGGWKREQLGVWCARARFETRQGSLPSAAERIRAIRESSEALGMHPDSQMGIDLQRSVDLLEGVQ